MHRPRHVDLLIFDFDGVIADSEILANRAGAQYFTELGAPTTLEQSLTLYMGKRYDDVAATVTAQLGRTLPANFRETYMARTLAALANELEPVTGARAFLEKTAHLKRCIASSSSHQRLALCLTRLELQATFAKTVFSADDVTHGKPAPDIFLHAAHAMNITPSPRCIVIEDSPAGIQAAKAAGMTAIGLTAGGHSREGHRAKLFAAGADAVSADFGCIEKMIAL
jgi:HAD superfamily hydrolase (TIGR01509 family)